MTVHRLESPYRITRFGREIFRLEEITKADADETKSLPRSEGNALAQRKNDGRQFLARSRGRRRCVAPRENLELGRLQLKDNGPRDPALLPRRGPGQLGEFADHRLRLRKRHVAFKRVLRRDGLCRPTVSL